MDVLNVSFNVTGGHAFGVHGQDFFLYVLADAGLVLFQYLGLKFSLPVPGNRHIHFAKAGTQRFAAVAVAAVVCVLVLVVVFAVAQLVIQLCLQAILHEFGNGFLEQILNVIHAADVCHLQQLTDLLSTGIFFRGTILSGHMVILLCGASILHHSGGLHKAWDSLEHTAYGPPFITVDWSKKPRIEDVLSTLETAAARDPASPEEPSVCAVGNLAVTPDDGPDILALCRAAEQQVNIWLVICADSQETLDLVYRTIADIRRAERIRCSLDAEDLRQTLACSSEMGTIRINLNAETFRALCSDGYLDTRGTVRVVSRVSACSVGWEGPVTEGTSFIVVSASVQDTSKEEYEAFHHLLEQTSQYAAENTLILPLCLSGCGDCFTQIFRSDVLFQTAPLTDLPDSPADDAYIVSLVESLWGDSSSN